jgi:hypothetical protein
MAATRPNRRRRRRRRRRRGRRGQAEYGGGHCETLGWTS